MQQSGQSAEVPSDVQQAIDWLKADLVGKPVKCGKDDKDGFFTVASVMSAGQRKICFNCTLLNTGKPFSATYELTPNGVLQSLGTPRGS